MFIFLGNFEATSAARITLGLKALSLFHSLVHAPIWERPLVNYHYKYMIPLHKHMKPSHCQKAVFLNNYNRLSGEPITDDLEVFSRVHPARHSVLPQSNSPVFS